MGHEELHEYIDQLNGGVRKRTIDTWQISLRVDVAKVWPDKPNGSGIRLFCVVFFIKNDEGEYIGAVLDMTCDLQWYIVKEHRGRGYLTVALRETILPFIFSDSRKYKRDTQEITIDGDSYEASKRVAESVGFKQISQTKFELKKVDFDRCAKRLI